MSDFKYKKQSLSSELLKKNVQSIGQKTKFPNAFET